MKRLLFVAFLLLSSFIPQQTEEELIQEIYTTAQACISELPEGAMSYEVSACYDSAFEQVMENASEEVKETYADKAKRKRLILKAMMLEK